MFLYYISISLYIFLPVLHGKCFSNSSVSWTCDGSGYEPVDFEYQTVLAGGQVENVSLTNYNWIIFRIDNYSMTLRVFNASGNRISSLIIVKKTRSQSNLRQLILESNDLQELNVRQIYFPESIERISLVNNRLTMLDARLFSRLTNLIELDLTNNRLRRILPELVLRFTVNLNDNPLDCRCTSASYEKICRRATNMREIRNGSDEKCAAPYLDRSQYFGDPLVYLRFSTITLICPIRGEPAPVIVWSTPFGTLSSVNSSDIDLLPIDMDENLYVSLTARAGPLGTQTRHNLNILTNNRLSITRARAALENRFACSAVNMLGTYRHEFDFKVDSSIQERAIPQLLYTLAFGVFLSLIGGVLCVSFDSLKFHTTKQIKTPPLYPTLTPNSAARTPPNFELNQWLSSAAANITGTLEQVRDKLRSGVQQMTEHMGRASGLLTQRVHQAAEYSESYLQSFRETSQQYLNTVRIQTLSSLRNPGQLMRSGMNMLTTQVNSLRDYCGVTTGVPLTTNYLLQQQQEQLSAYGQYPHSSMSIFRQQNFITSIAEENESNLESSSLIELNDLVPYTGHTHSYVLSEDSSGIGILRDADKPVSSVLNYFHIARTNSSETDLKLTEGCLSAGIGIFHSNIYEPNEEFVSQSDTMIIHGQSNATKTSVN